MTFLLSAWGWLAGSKMGRAVAIAGAAVAAVMLIWWRGKAAGRRGAALDHYEETEERVKDARDAADKTRRDLAGVDDDDLDPRLRDHGL